MGAPHETTTLQAHSSEPAAMLGDTGDAELARPEAGFGPLMRSSPFLERVGPLFCRRDEHSGQWVFGLRVLAHHCNAGGSAHGGLLGTLADVALGYSTAFSREPAVPMTTVSLRMDFSGSARLGDWLEVHTQVQKIGRRLAFADARMVCGEQPVASASAVFQIQNG